MKKILSLFLSTILVAGCGPTPNFSGKSNRSVFSYFAESNCREYSSQDRPATIQSIEKLYIGLDKNLSQFFHFPLGNLSNFQLPSASNIYLSPDEPLKVNEKILATKLSDLKKRLSQLVGSVALEHVMNNQLAEQNQLTPLMSQIALLSEVKKLWQESERWISVQCRLEDLAQNENKDVRDYLYLKKIQCKDDFREKCLETTLKNWNTSSHAEKSNIQSALLAMCRQSKGKARCQSEWSAGRSKGQLMEFYHYYFERFEEMVFHQYFGLQHGLKRKCRRTDDGVVHMEIPVFMSARDKKRLHFGLTLSLGHAEAKWSSAKFKLKLKEVKRPLADTINLKMVNTRHSYVAKDKPNTIHLGASTPSNLFGQVLAHELGHSLGFPDCYIEYYSREERTLVYYELDLRNKNIMCSLNNEFSAPDEYLTQLSDQICNFD